MWDGIVWYGERLSEKKSSKWSPILNTDHVHIVQSEYILNQRANSIVTNNSRHCQCIDNNTFFPCMYWANWCNSVLVFPLGNPNLMLTNTVLPRHKIFLGAFMSLRVQRKPQAIVPIRTNLLNSKMISDVFATSWHENYT